MLIFRRTNCIITASGIVTVCKRPCSTPVESGAWPPGLTLVAGGRKHPSLGVRWIAWSMLPGYR